MVTFPVLGNVTFFDYTTKVAWLMSKAALNSMDEDAQSKVTTKGQDKSRDPRSTSGVKEEARPSDELRTTALTIGIPLTIISPLCSPILILMAFFALWVTVRSLQQIGPVHRKGSGLSLAGVMCILSLGILFIGPMLVLWGAPDRVSTVAVGVTSFGFGWGILLAGSVLVLMAGMVQ
jgi:hypothetical protein